MPPSHSIKKQAEAALTGVHFDFIAKYHAVTDLRRLARKEPGTLDRETITALEQLLRSDAFSRVRQSYFLFREAACVMCDMACAPGANGMRSRALVSLEGLLRQTRGSAHRGVAEALGSLPVNIHGPQPVGNRPSSTPPVAWRELFEAKALTPVGTPWYIGRSLVTPLSRENRLLVVKLAKKDDRVEDLQKEIQWMETLHRPDYAVDCRFHIPEPLRIRRQPVFRLARLPLAPPSTLTRHPGKLAIAFVAHRDYFVYPNHPRVDGPCAREMLARNAFLMGHLAARGIIHDAPIPLFHNRTQRMRRNDQGRYQWFRAGRLDQWLDSCAFPNLGLSGLRDFEHLESVGGESHLLYRQIGSHFLSLLLVAGSHFRCRDSSRKGLTETGTPVDTRDLFDPHLLKSMIGDIFGGYYSGFAGTAPPPDLPLDPDRLVARMIEEMGMDRYMTERLRRVDQQQMSDTQFHDFLRSKGVPDETVGQLKRAEKDILIASGPHLGDFNRQISLTELIEAVAAMSAVCVMGRFLAARH
ncbi:SidJ-related pseudokinase [Desulfosarcina ovata]|uniref:Uncharacterized protein n=1 Tax=Desulfosarcina ovata subsp. ovata TaxID=2752305 RepID=A0A5K8AHW1_9BACT|nr:SidJ-related pseudokinase [Desulfosarcina ovata]BBO92283.1 hypothetical protein DSCOOX_54630 [Desulfosarcina ovata subsp. ovata]